MSGVMDTSECPSRLRIINEVDICLRRDLKRKLRLAVRMGDGKVSGIDDVHADQHIPSGKPTLTNWDVLYHYAVRKAEVDQIHIGLIWFFINPRVHKLCPAYWLQPALVHHVLSDDAMGRACILNGKKLVVGFSGISTREPNFARGNKNVRQPIGGHGESPIIRHLGPQHT